MRLNPFLYISETSILFALLVVTGIVMPSLYIADWFFRISDLVGGLVMRTGTVLLPSDLGISITKAGIGILETGASLQNSLFSRIIINAITIFLIPILIYRIYREFPREIIKKSKLKALDPYKFAELWTHVQELYGNAPNIRAPVLMYQPLDSSITAFAFGSGNLMYLGLSGGLIRKFRTDRAGFDSIVSHEIAHLTNKDVGKVYLTEAVWRTLRFILPAFIGTVLAGSTVLAIGLSESYSSWLALLVILGSYSLYFLIFMAVVFAIRKRIIRAREFYADAKVVEWQGSQKKIAETLMEFTDEQYSRFRGLTKLHPRIRLLAQIFTNWY